MVYGSLNDLVGFVSCMLNVTVFVSLSSSFFR